MADLPILDIYLYGLSGVVIRSIPLGDGRVQLHIGRPGRLGLKLDKETGNWKPNTKHKYGPGGSFDGHLRMVAVAGGWWSSPDHDIPVVDTCGGSRITIDGEQKCPAGCKGGSNG